MPGKEIQRSQIPDVRVPVGTHTYYGKKDSREGRRLEMSLKEGQSPFGPPPEYYTLVSDLANSGRLAEAGVGYKELDAAPLESYIKKRFNAKDVGIVFDTKNASDGLILDIVKLIHHEKKIVQVWGIGPHFTGLNEAIINYRDENAPDERRLLYDPIVSPDINQPTEETLVRAIGVRNQDVRKNEDGTDILHMWYVCNPGTPKGERLDPRMLRSFLRYTKEKGDMVVVDEVFGDALPDHESVIRSIQAHPGLIALRSFSKYLGLGGARFGYAAMHPDMKKRFEKLERPYGNGYTQLIIPELVQIQDKETGELVVARHIREVQEKIAGVKLPLLDAFYDAGIAVTTPTHPTTPIFMFQGVLDAENLARSLEGAGMLVAPGDGFGDTHPTLKLGNHVRMSIPPDIKDIERVRDIVLKAM